MCIIRLCSNRICIPKPLQCLALETPSKLVTGSFCNVLIKVCFFNCTQFDNEIGFITMFALTAFTSNKRSFHFVPMGRTFSTTFIPIGVYVFCAALCQQETMMVSRVLVACRVASVGFVKPKFPWVRDRRPFSSISCLYVH